VSRAAQPLVWLIVAGCTPLADSAGAPPTSAGAPSGNSRLRAPAGRTTNRGFQVRPLRL